MIAHALECACEAVRAPAVRSAAKRIATRRNVRGAGADIDGNAIDVSQ
jgi:hypothetical protein